MPTTSARCSALREAKYAFQRRFHGLDVISRVVAEPVVSAIAILSFRQRGYHSTLAASSAPEAHSTAGRGLSHYQSRGQSQLPSCYSMQKSFMQQQ